MSASGVWNFLQTLHYLSISLWVGGIVFLSAVAAPSIHGSVISRALAGQVVRRMLERFNMIEFGACFFLIATSLSALRYVSFKRGCVGLALAAILMGLVTSYYALSLGPRMERLKASAPVFETLPETDPARVEFKALHHLYVRLMGLNLVLGLGLLYGSVVIFSRP